MLLSSKISAPHDINAEITRIKKKLDEKREFKSSIPNIESDDNEYQVMHSPYANDEEALYYSNRDPPEGQFKRINLVPLCTQSMHSHPTNKEVVLNKKDLSKDNTEKKVLNESWQFRKLPKNSVEKPNTDLKPLTDLSKSQKFEKQLLSGDGMFVKQKDSKGDYYYLCDDNQIKKHAKVYENSLKKSENVKKPTRPSFLFKRQVSSKDIESNTTRRIIPHRPAPPPPNTRNIMDNSDQKTTGKKEKSLTPNITIFEDFRQDSKFSIYAAQMKAQYGYL